MPKSLEIRTGEVIKELRIALGYSQEDLANACEMERTHISAIERAVRTPSLSTLFKLAEALDKKPSEVVRLIEEKK